MIELFEEEKAGLNFALTGAEFIAGSRRYWEGMDGEGDLENWFE